jgi:hypothetical protein
MASQVEIAIFWSALLSKWARSRSGDDGDGKNSKLSRVIRKVTAVRPHGDWFDAKRQGKGVALI